MPEEENLMVIRMIDPHIGEVSDFIQSHGIEFVGRIGTDLIIIQPYRVYKPAYIENLARSRRERGIPGEPPVSDSWKMIVKFDDLKRFIEMVEAVKDDPNYSPGDKATNDIYFYDSPEVS